jgi:carbamoyl-phosphate synthase large subunit
VRDGDGNILVASCGRRVELLDCLRADVDALGLSGRLVAMDVSPLAPAAYHADAFELVPHVDEPTYLGAVRDIIKRHDIVLLVPTIDTELHRLSAAAAELRSMGTRVAISGRATIRISSDKENTSRFLRDEGLPCPAQWTATEALVGASTLPYPVVVKPRWGSSSVGVARVDDPAALRAATASDDYVVQSLASGHELTLDVWVDLEGRVRSCVPRRRIAVRAGEVSKGVTEYHPTAIEVAERVVGGLPDAYGPLTVQLFADGDQIQVIEINARFGGGYPLSWAAGARTTRWAIQDALGVEAEPEEFEWRSGLHMLRYDRSVFVDEEEIGR